jgi:DNA-damage-inducible protein J
MGKLDKIMGAVGDNIAESMGVGRSPLGPETRRSWLLAERSPEEPMQSLLLWDGSRRESSAKRAQRHKTKLPESTVRDKTELEGRPEYGRPFAYADSTALPTLSCTGPTAWVESSVRRSGRSRIWRRVVARTGLRQHRLDVELGVNLSMASRWLRGELSMCHDWDTVHGNAQPSQDHRAMPKTDQRPKTKAVKRATTGKTGMIRARVQPSLKIEAERILSKLGLNPSDAVRLFYKQVVIQKGLPFAVRVPNAATVKAIHDADAGRNLTRYVSVDEMFEDIDD